MKRSSKSKLDVVGRLSLGVKAVDVIVASKRTNDILIKCPPFNGWEESIENLATKNDDENKAMFRLQKQMLESANTQAIIDTSRTAQLEEMVNNLRQNFIKTNLFMQACDEKRLKALQVVSEEKLVHAAYKKDNLKLKEDVEVMLKFRNALTETVKDFEPYEAIINEAVAISEVWTSPKDVMYRCDAIMMAQEEILNKKTEKFAYMGKVRQKMIKLTDDAVTSILGMKTKLNHLERRLSQAQFNCLYWEKKLVEVKNILIENQLAKHRMVEAIDKLYRMLCARRKILPSQGNTFQWNIEKRLDFIKDEIFILSKVLTKCEKSLKVGTKRKNM